MAIAGSAGSAVASTTLRILDGRLDQVRSGLMHSSQHETEVHVALHKMLRGEWVNIPLDGDMLQRTMDAVEAWMEVARKVTE